MATFFGCGYLKQGPGTWASAATCVLWYFAARGARGGWLALGTAIAAVVVTALGVAASSVVERESGRHDPGFVVIDEVAGQLIALLGIAAQWQYALASLILFRSFDITKPPPLRRLEKLPHGWGIMLDDVGAGVYACVLLQVAQWWMRGH